MTRLIDRLGPEQARHAWDDETIQIRRCIEEAMLFEIADDPGPAGSPGSASATSATMSRLRDAFYEKLLVPRSEIAEICECVGKGTPVLLEGYAGSGKTTALAVARRDIDKRANVRTVLLNLKNSADDIIRSRGVVWQRLGQALLDLVAEKSFVPQWRRYRIQNSAEHLLLRQGLMERNTSWESTTEDLVLSTSEDLELREADKKLVASPLAYTSCLLRFLAASGCRIVAMFDGIDRFDSAVVAEIVQQIRDITTGENFWDPIIALRRATYLRAVRHDGGASIERRHRFTPTWSTAHESLQREDVKRRIRTTPWVVDEFLRRRLTYVTGELAGQEVRSGEFVGKFWSVYHKLLDANPNFPLGERMCQWHNHSLRAIAVALFTYVTTLLSDADPYYSLESLQRDEEIDIRTLRTSLYCNLIAPGRALSLPNVITMDRTPIVAQKGRTRFSFAELAVLAYTRRRDPSNTPISQLQGDLARLGYTATDIAEALRGLLSDPGSAMAGMLLADNEVLRDNIATVELLPKGALFYDKICVSCEYFFWVALHEPVDGKTIPAVARGSTHYGERLQSDQFRFDVAFWLLETRVLDAHLSEMRMMRDAMGAAQEDILQLLADRDGKLFLDRVFYSFDRFLEHARFRPGEETAWISNRKRRLAKLRERLDREKTQ